MSALLLPTTAPARVSDLPRPTNALTNRAERYASSGGVEIGAAAAKCLPWPLAAVRLPVLGPPADPGKVCRGDCLSTWEAAGDVKKNWVTWRPIHHARGSLSYRSGGLRCICLRAAVPLNWETSFPIGSGPETDPASCGHPFQHSAPRV